MNISKINVNGTSYDIHDATGELIYTLTNVRGTAAVTTSPYYASIWTGTSSGITSLYTGLMVNIKVPVAGNSTYGVVLNVNNLGEKPVISNVNTNISTRYAVGCIITLIYDADLSTTVVYLNSTEKKTITGCWKISDYNSDADAKTSSSNKASTKLYLVGATSQSTSGQTTYSNSNVYIGTDNCLYSNGKVVPFNKELGNEDLNSITIPGFYNAGGGNTCTNKPSGVLSFGLEVIHTAAGSYYTQIVYKGGTNTSYRRNCSNGTWSDWVEEKLTDTTYTSKAAASGGTDTSLVTTGEKYTWNAKQGAVAKLGSTTKPVYTSAAGTFAECSTYAGGTAVTLNGTSKAASTATMFAPTSAGTAGQVLTSSGSGAPIWKEETNITVGNIVGEFSDDSKFTLRPTARAVDVESGKAGKGAKIESIKGNTLVWNQLVPNDYRTGTLVTSKQWGGFYTGGLDIISGHKYYICAKVSGVSSQFSIGIGTSSKTDEGVRANFSSNGLVCAIGTWTPKGSGKQFYILNATATSVNITISNVQVFDLTRMFGAGNEPSTMSAFRQIFSGSNYDYDAGSLLNMKANGLETVGFNLYDISAEDISTKTLHYCTASVTNDDLTLTATRDGTVYWGWGGGESSYIPSLGAKFPCQQGWPIKPEVTNSKFYLHIIYFDSNGKLITYHTVNNQSYICYPPAGVAFFTVRINADDCEIGKSYSTKICIHLLHSGARNGEYESPWKSTLNLPITTMTGKLNGTGNSSVVFPDGMKSVGSVHDEISDNKAVKRIGIQTVTGAIGDTITLTGCKTSATTFLCASELGTLSNGVLTLTAAATNAVVYYELATPEIYTLDEFALPQVYDADDWGTEMMTTATGVTSAPIALNIKYGINAPDTIKNLPHNYVSAVGEQNFTEAQKARARNNIGVTEYESKEAVSEGTDVSLVTTGEKAVWNAKQNALTNPVTGTGLTADKIVLGNGTTTVKTSSKGITTTAPTSSSDDTTIPTSKAVWDVITNHSHSDYEDYLTDLLNKVSMSITTTGVRGHIESSPTLLSYTGDKNSINNILSHFKLGWFDGNGNLVKECAPGRISADIHGNNIAIDGTVGDLMVYVDTDIYVDRATVNNVTIPDSSASSHNIIGLGLVPHKFGNKIAKKFEPFGFTPHHAKYKSNIPYSYYNNLDVDKYISGLNNSIRAINKGGGYMGLYYEFYEIWYIAMYLELGTLDFTRDDLFGPGCTNNTPTSSNWYSNSIEGGGGVLLSSGVYDKYNTNNFYTGSGIIPVKILDPLYIMDGITKAGFLDLIGGTTLYTYDDNGDVILVTDTNPSSWENASGMTQDKEYFTVKNVNGCLGISDGVMTGIVNVYIKKESFILKVSYVVYRGVVLLDGLYTQVVGLNYVVKHTGTTKSTAQSEQIFYADSWKDVPTNISLYNINNTYITANSEEGLNEDPLFVLGYKKSEEFPVSNTFSGWIKESDYNISIFAFKTFGASKHTYECGHCWSQGISDSIPGISDNTGINSNAKIVNNFLVGSQGNLTNEGRGCNNTFSLRNGHICMNVGFSHPLIKL